MELDLQLRVQSRVENADWNIQAQNFNVPGSELYSHPRRPEKLEVLSLCKRQLTSLIS